MSDSEATISSETMTRLWRILGATGNTMARIDFVVTELDKARYQRQAQREKKSLSAWLREAAEQKLVAATGSAPFTLADLRRFNAECESREKGYQEPDWPEHKRMIAKSTVPRLNGP
ncbi:MAG: hypothetical protein OXT71_16115 [Acidobacteriota bacterium]|nr:hypothetical protein [Acidobacteriota bacterium]